MIFAGLDLAGRSQPKKTCLVLLQRKKGEWRNLPRGHLLNLYCGLSDEEILKIVSENTPSVLSIDAPLSVPQNTWREVDIRLRELLRKIYPPFMKWVLPPVKLRQMRILTERGIHISKILKNKTEIIETHPRASFLFLFGEVLKNPLDLYKKRDKKTRKEALLELTLTLECLIGGIFHKIINDDAMDATFSAYVSLLYKEKPDSVWILTTQDKYPPFVVPKLQTLSI